MAYQSLYRRYRPQKFSEIRGQEHVVLALRNAVRDDRVGHAYMLSGPRGTGKTTAARVLAKVLNCENPVDGEPDGTCDSCKSIEAGTSFDLHELDAASNNKVDDIRDLLSKVALGTPGRTKVYLLDEVHMLTPGAENALLKTLEEPPDHVVFVLATTEPHKVVATIRSRTQQLQLSLIPAEQMAEMLYEIANDAGLTIDEEIVGHVIKTGGGSARDALSALDQIVAAGGVTDVDTSTAELLEALASQDAGVALHAIDSATTRGVDPRRIGERFIDALRNVFLLKMGSPPGHLSEPEAELANAFVDRLSPATMTRSLETIGRSLVDMRQAPDPRIDLEVAFVRITNPTTGSDITALIARIEALEATATTGAAPAEPAQPTPQAEPLTAEPVVDEPAPGSRPADAARAAMRPRKPSGPAESAPNATKPAPVPATEVPAPEPATEVPAPEPATEARKPEPATEAPAPEPAGESSQAPTGSATIEQIRMSWASFLDAQSTKARARFKAGTVEDVNAGVVTISFQNDAMLKRSQEFVGELQGSMHSTFGEALQIALVTNAGNGAPSAPSGAGEPTVAAENEVDIHDLTDADAGNTVVEQIADVFPGAEVMTQPES